jgi:hypothetical protein
MPEVTQVKASIPKDLKRQANPDIPTALSLTAQSV